MTAQTAPLPQRPPAPPRERRGRWTWPAVVLFVLSAVFTAIGIQSVGFYAGLAPRAARADALLVELLAARASGDPAGVADGEDPYRQLLADLQEPPWYLRPTATVLARRSSLQEAVRFNAATYLAQVGERGTARVILTGLHAGVRDPQMAGLVSFSLGRLYFELFRDRPDPESFVRALEYLRQSVRADPDAPLARELFAYLLALDYAPSGSQQGQGSAESTGEGERAAETRQELVF